MGLFEFIGVKKKELTLDQVKREEIKLGIRETQTLAKLEKLEKEREEIFAKGMKIKSPPRRRQLARLYEMKSSGVKMMERELSVMSKEITTISALKLALERRHSSKEGVARILERVDEAKLMTYLEDDKISQEMYLEKLNGVLSTVTDGANQITEELGKEGSEVMDVWQKMDEGEIENFSDGLKLADKAVREKEKRDSEMEAE
jgi:cob(I)alamin adenosyltransferase